MIFQPIQNLNAIHHLTQRLAESNEARWYFSIQKKFMPKPNQQLFQKIKDIPLITIDYLVTKPVTKV